MVRLTAVGKKAATRVLLLAASLALSGMTSCVRQCDGDGVLGARERVLKQDLFTLREQIDSYTKDKDRAPQSLQDLVAAGYLKKIPRDPLTGSEETWITEREPSVDQDGQIEFAITDVHSGANLVGCDGSAYSSW